MKLRHLFVAAAMAVVAVVSCQKNALPETSDQEQEYVTVQLGMGGELDVTYEPMTRGNDNNDLYGIQVYSAPKDQENPSWSYYAYGLFDDVSDITVSLLKGFQYKFVATMVVDGKNKLYCYTDGYHTPFWRGGDNTFGNEAISDNFTYSSLNYLPYIDDGDSYLICRNSYGRPNTDRYYGELVGYVPEDSSNDKAKIKMVRTSFQATFQAKGKLAVTGQLEILMDKAPAVVLDLANEKKHSDYYTFYYVKKAHDNKNSYEEKIDVSINWYYQNEDGSTVAVPLGTHKITYPRVQNTVLHINLENTNVDGGIGFELTEAGEMAAGAEYTINDGGNIDTEIDPNK